MFDYVHVAGQLAAADDPRLDERYLRCLAGGERDHTVLLVGVVHDHPASVARVVRVLDLFEPATLALELPPLAMPLFRQYAADGQQPPRLGGEMSAAIQASDSRSIGVDAPTLSYLTRLGRQLARERPSPGLLARVGRDLTSAMAHAVTIRLASVVAAYTPLRLRVYDPIVHDCSLVDGAHVQAAHERAYLDRRDALFRAIRAPESTRIIDEAREASMSDLLHRARAEGSVVAIVGMEHLDAIETALQRRTATAD